MAIPTVASADPSRGTGGTSVTLTGTGFTGATSVALSGLACTYTVDSDTQISATVPAPNTSGSVAFTVTTPDGDSSAGTVNFTYVSAATTRFDVPTARSGCVMDPARTGTKGGERFNMEVDFSSADDCMCSCAEYRQYVRGAFTLNGTAVNHLLPGPSGGPPIKLLPRPAAGAAADNFLEDGVSKPNANVNAHYGRRSEGSLDSTDVYQSPDRATGCRYRGNDYPGVRGAAGVAYTVDLDFRGTVVDVCNIDNVLQQSDWTVSCSGTF